MSLCKQGVCRVMACSCVPAERPLFGAVSLIREAWDSADTPSPFTLPTVNFRPTPPNSPPYLSLPSLPPPSTPLCPSAPLLSVVHKRRLSRRHRRRHFGSRFFGRSIHLAQPPPLPSCDFGVSGDCMCRTGWTLPHMEQCFVLTSI